MHWTMTKGARLTPELLEAHRGAWYEQTTPWGTVYTVTISRDGHDWECWREVGREAVMLWRVDSTTVAAEMPKYAHEPVWLGNDQGR